MKKIPKYVHEKIKCYKAIQFIRSSVGDKQSTDKDLESCPFCAEKGTFLASKKSYDCTSCEAHGDVVSFIMAYLFYTYDEALDRLKFDKEIFS